MRLPTLLALAFLLSAGSPTRIASLSHREPDLRRPAAAKWQTEANHAIPGDRRRVLSAPRSIRSLRLHLLRGRVHGGWGVRGWLTDRVYALADVRFGWELHARVNAGIGIGL